MPARSDGMPAVASGDAVWRRSPKTAYVESPDRAVVLDLDHPDLPPYVFEGTAATIWGHVDGTRSESAIVTALSELYDAPVETVSADVRAFLTHLDGLGLVLAVRID